MQLKEFQIQYYRSIEDSGPISVSNMTAIIGRNESGKSNLLQALRFLNPPENPEPLKKNEIFPRHMNLDDCTDSTTVATSKWELSDSDKDAITEVWPQAKFVNQVEVRRNYAGNLSIDLVGADNVGIPKKQLELASRKLFASLDKLIDPPDSDAASHLDDALDVLDVQLEPTDDHFQWTTDVKESLVKARQHLSSIDKGLTEERDALFKAVEDIVEDVSKKALGQKKACSWIAEHMPVFIFLDVYPEMTGRMNVAEHLSRKASNTSTLADENFDKICKAAGLDLERLQTLHKGGEQRIRKKLTNEAGEKLTKAVQRLWRDKKLKVRFDVDGDHISTFISEPSGIRDVDIELNERSRGFQWFFSFYVTFAADTKEGDATNAIILLDEPGLYLHAKSQRDLLRHLEEDFNNQILYTTHSPFMVPIHNLDSIRTVMFNENKGTTISNSPVRGEDSNTLFPLQAALGYDLAQSLFVSQNNLIVEGKTDYLILSTVSEYLARKKKESLRSDITITPAGGAQKILYMVAFLSSEKLNVLVLLDHEKGALNTRDEIVKTKLIRDKNIIFTSEAFGKSAPSESDIEDLLDADIYEELVRESYSEELNETKFKITNNAPRIAMRFNEEFKKNGIEFNKSRPIRIFISKMANNPEHIITPDVEKRFSALYRKINTLMTK